MSHLNRRVLARIGSGAVALLATGAMIGLAGPAQAVPSAPAEDAAAAAGPDLSVAIPGPQVSVGSSGKDIRVDVALGDLGAPKADNVVLALGFTSAGDALTVTLPGTAHGCGAASVPASGTGSQAVAATVDCALGTIDAKTSHGTVAVRVVPKAGATPGVVGTLTATVTSDGDDPEPANNTTTVDVVLVPDTFDLVARSADISVEQGQTVALNVGVTNAGSIAVKAIDIAITLPSYLLFADKIPHCTYQETPVSAALCRFHGLAPGFGGREERLTVKLDPTTHGPRSLGTGTIAAIGFDELEPASLAAQAVPAVRGELAPAIATPAIAAAVTGDASPGDDTVTFSVFAGANKADIEITSTAVSGAVGSVVQVPFSFINKGPATGGGELKVKAPAGTVLLDSTPGSGTPGCFIRGDDQTNGDFTEAAEAICNWEGETLPNVRLDFKLKFKIKSSFVGSDGKVEAYDVLGTPDPVAANNTAKVTITVTGSGGSLPVTGVQVGVIGAVGAGVVALGGLLLLLSRRRVVPIAAAQEANED